MSYDWSGRLRHEIAERATGLAQRLELPSYSSGGGTRLFHAFDDGARHGNFNDETYAAILANDSWQPRLTKAHTHRESLPAGPGKTACEMDSSNSSDALLMNCFCYPGAAERIVTSLLPDVRFESPEFGAPGDVQLSNGKVDSTEVDMRIGNAIFESKLTERDFTSKAFAVVERYRALNEVFDTAALPKSPSEYKSYQLIRNVLAAAQHGWAFYLLCDARRPDLLHEWWAVHSAIRDISMRRRCGFLLWQEVAAVSPPLLRSFLGEKYGLVA
jgi:hypothetical protein